LAFSGDDDPRSVLQRTRALLGVAARSVPSKLEGFGIVLDSGAHRALYRGRDIRLAEAQFRLLEYFLKNPGRILSRHELFSTLWGKQGTVGRRIDVYVGNLRKLLSSRNGNKLIRTVRGTGYVFDGGVAKGRRLSSRLPKDHEVVTTCASVSVDQFRLDYAGRSLRIDGVQFSLSPREFAVLELLMLNPDMTFNRSMIANCIWAEDKVDLRTVDATISRLRKAIKQRSSSDRPIRSVIGRGYQFST
jgi:DNA-binding response OmpR family regulator